MFSIRRLITSSSSCRAIQNASSLRRAALSTSTTIRQEVSDLSSQKLSNAPPKPLPANYRPLHNLNRSIPKEPFTELVSLQNLPDTATKEDILRLARQAFHDAETPIKEILFVRNQELQFNGRVLVVFENAKDAEHFRLMNDHVVVGGNQVKVNRVDTKNLSSNDLLKGFRKSEMYSANGKTAAGRTVILSGFPQRTNTSHVSRWLHSKGYYPEDDEENAIIQAPTKQQALVSKFFIRFPSESDAWRAVRRFHNVTFRPNTFNNRYTIKATVAY
ncbi:hypothetical protein NQZ79_g4350 [Umbelopsis isabellina]|nr:hypothetical protein NQZ79_g4350 [Umbelopsis isabellina]